MKIHATRNTVAAALVFTVLSGVTGISDADLSEVSIDAVLGSYAELNTDQPRGDRTLYAQLDEATCGACDREGRRRGNSPGAAGACGSLPANRGKEV